MARGVLTRVLKPQLLILICAAVLLAFPSTSRQVKSQSLTQTSNELSPEYIAETDNVDSTPAVLGLSTLANGLATALDEATANSAQTPADCSQVACLALTFDDGPDPATTPKIIDAIDNEHAIATFFLIGNRIGPNASIVKRLSDEGYAVGNHSWSHPDFTKLNGAQIEQQITMTQKAVTDLGLSAPTMFRFPYGSRNAFVRSHIHLPIIMWNVDPKDWREKDPAKIVQLVEAQAKTGAIILMHDRAPTAAAVPQIVHDLKAKYRLVTVPELLGLTTESQGEFFGR